MEGLLRPWILELNGIGFSDERIDSKQPLARKNFYIVWSTFSLCNSVACGGNYLFVKNTPVDSIS